MKNEHLKIYRLLQEDEGGGIVTSGSFSGGVSSTTGEIGTCTSSDFEGQLPENFYQGVMGVTKTWKPKRKRKPSKKYL